MIVNIRRIVLIVLTIIPLFSYSQYWEVGLFGGESHYSGDLTVGFIDVKEIHPSYGGIVRYNVSQWFTVKGNIYYGEISGNDANSKVYDRQVRNLSFKSTMLDIGLQGEINLRGYKAGHPRYKNTPYLFGGLSVFRFNPKALYKDTWYELQPLGTEGQGTTKYNDRLKYALTQVSLPFGMGWKYAINRYWNVGFEIGARSTFTDYLDDVSMTYVEKEVITAAHGYVSAALANRSDIILGEPVDYGPSDDRGDPTKLDWYYFSGITVTYNILPNQCYRF